MVYEFLIVFIGVVNVRPVLPPPPNPPGPPRLTAQRPYTTPPAPIGCHL